MKPAAGLCPAIAIHSILTLLVLLAFTQDLRANYSGSSSENYTNPPYSTNLAISNPGVITVYFSSEGGAASEQEGQPSPTGSWNEVYLGIENRTVSMFADSITVTNADTGVPLAASLLLNNTGPNACNDTGACSVTFSGEGTGLSFNGSSYNNGISVPLSWAGSSGSGSDNESLNGSAVLGAPSGTYCGIDDPNASWANGTHFPHIDFELSYSYTGAFSFYAPAGRYTITETGGAVYYKGIINGEGATGDASYGNSGSFTITGLTNVAGSDPLPTGSLKAVRNAGAGGVTLQWSIMPSN